MITNYLKSCFIAAMFASMVLTACRNTKAIVSTPVEELGQDEYSGFDEKQKLRYVISHDQENLYLLLNTADPVTVMKLTRMELTFYFDLPKEKKKSLYVQYPVKKERTQGQQGRPDGQMRPNQERQFDLNSIISRLPDEALFYADGAGVVIDRKGAATGISVEISAAGPRELDYALTMPIHLITSQSVDGLEGLKVGIESQSQQDQSQMNRGQMGGGRSGGGGARGGGGIPPGGGREGGMRGGSQNSQNLGSAINIWFELSIPSDQ